MPESRKPNIRFKGFTEAWEQRKLNEIATFLTGSGLSWDNISENGMQECILYGNLYTDYGMIIEKVKYKTNKKISTPVLSQKGDVLIPASDTTPTGLARATSIEVSSVLLGGDINIIRPNSSYNGSCLSLVINANKKELIMLIKGTTVRHIHNSDIQNIEVNIPQVIEEQEKLVELFKELDNLITLHQHKCEKLQNIKKSMLEKMFPKNGNNVPEIRFKGFTEAWEQRKLNEVAEIVGGGTPSTSNPAYWDGDIDWYSPTEIGESVYANGSVRTISQLGYEKSSAKLLPANKTILFTSRAGIGDMAILKRSGATNQGFQSLVLTSECDTYFIYSSGHKIKKYALTNASGSTFLEISGKQLGNMDILVPSIEEQKQIGSYFMQLDNLITLRQRECEKLQNIKKSMLEKMFV